MIKSIKPGLLAGLRDAQIENKLGQLFNCDVEYSNGVAKIHCIDQYDSDDDGDDSKAYAAMFRHLGKLRKVGNPRVVCDKTGVYIELEFNSIAMDVISGERARREAKRINQHKGE